MRMVFVPTLNNTHPHEREGYRYVFAGFSLVLEFSTTYGAAIPLPEDYYCNGFSIPRGLRWIAGSPWQKGWQAAVWHDAMRELIDSDSTIRDEYERGYGKVWWDVETADQVFRALMEHYGVSRWKRWAFFRAVKLGNWAGKLKAKYSR